MPSNDATMVPISSENENQSSGNGIKEEMLRESSESMEHDRQMQQETANKRAALAGQWRTPPLPSFPSSTSTAIASTGANVVAKAPESSESAAAAAIRTEAANASENGTNANETTVPLDLCNLPDSTEDYAKALQEAYRRGAEAAQAMAVAAASKTPGPAAVAEIHPTPTAAMPQVHPPTTAAADALPTTVSCPDFEKAILPNPTGTPANHTAPAPSSNTTTSAPAASSVPNPLSMPPPPPQPSHILSSQPPVTAAAAGGIVLPVPVAPINPLVAPLAPAPQAGVKPLAPPQAPAVANQGTMLGSNAMATTAANPLAVPGVPPVPQQRSMSLPDMSSYAAQQEEEKRQKRLARNRASARLRRLRKKNLVEAYEQEVGILEKTLKQLQAHDWGSHDSVAALTEALSMDRGQQALDANQRHQAATALLEQQLQWLEMLQEIMMEDYVLQSVASGEGGFADLENVLNLSPEQRAQIQESRAGWAEEWAALQTVQASLQALRDHDWLWNESVSGIADQFMAILHKNQVSKFLLWADHNAEAIDELDTVHAMRETVNAPIFCFGMESQPGDMEEEKP